MEDKAIDEMVSRITKSLATEIVKKLAQGFKKQEQKFRERSNK